MKKIVFNFLAVFAIAAIWSSCSKSPSGCITCSKQGEVSQTYCLSTFPDLETFQNRIQNLQADQGWICGNNGSCCNCSGVAGFDAVVCESDSAVQQILSDTSINITWVEYMVTLVDTGCTCAGNNNNTGNNCCDCTGVTGLTLCENDSIVQSALQISGSTWAQYAQGLELTGCNCN